MGAAMRHMSLFCGRRALFKAVSCEGVHSDELLSDDQLMNGFDSFVSNHALQIDAEWGVDSI